MSRVEQLALLLCSGVPFIASLRMAALLHRRLASIATSCDSCDAQGHIKGTLFILFIQIWVQILADVTHVSCCS